MKTKNLMIALGFIGLLASCSGTKVIMDMDKSIDFTAYKTYQLKQFDKTENLQVIALNELNEKRMLAAIESQMEISGMEVSENPDAYVVYGFDVDIKKGYSSNSSHMGGVGRYYGGGFGSGYSTTTETNTAQGTLTIALLDAETDDLLWISHGTKELKFNSKKIDENINEAVEKVFEDFPIEHYSGRQVDPEALSLK